MNATTNQIIQGARSQLSFLPLINKWKAIREGEGSLQAKISAHLIKHFSRFPELLEPIVDYELLEQHKDLIGEAMATVFPIIANDKYTQFAAVVPFSLKVVYASELFRKLHVNDENYIITQLPNQDHLIKARLNLAYKLILRKFYQVDLPGGETFISIYPDPENSLQSYFELEWDTQFVDITADEELPPLPPELTSVCHQATQLTDYPGLMRLLPLNKFIFHGFTILRICEVTEREATSRIKSILEERSLLEDPQARVEIQQQVRFLLQMPDIEIGISSFHEQDSVLSQVNGASLLMQGMEPEEQFEFSARLAERINDCGFYSNFQQSGSEEEDDVIRRQIEQSGWKNVVMVALYRKEELIGWMEICAHDTIAIDIGMINKVQVITDLLEVALQKNQQTIQNRIDKVIKEHFTAVQSTVEWKFREAAFGYLSSPKEETPKMKPITFSQVYPLYAMIDIRNSSGERNRALQEDLLQQLQWIKKILVRSQQLLQMPLLKEIESRVDEYILTVNSFLFAADEQAIQLFLKDEVEEVLQQIKEMLPQTAKDIGNYFAATGNRRHIITGHQHEYEESITAINNHILRMLEEEQAAAQAIYPHYFERFVTDGVEFNMYIGQAIAPGKRFNMLYLRNLRLWQLHFLALAARRIAELAPSLPVPMETTQLILVYTDPLSISFRTEERKFDVDGVYNARYEVVKKRIDKAHIKDTNERLTRAGHIAIVYSGEREAWEYLLYINYLKKQDVLTGEVEQLELEELQGVRGLKALRVQVLLEKKEPETAGRPRQFQLNQ